MSPKLPSHWPEWAPLAGVIIVLALLGGGYEAYAAYRDQIDGLNGQIRQLSDALTQASTTNAQLNQALIAEQRRNDNFENQIDDISGTVGTLNKLANTDPQLLAKYSKVYFLNENYVPKSLDDIPSKYTYDDGKDYQFLSDAEPFLEDLIDHARDDGIDLEVLSAYRSFADQASLKSGYKVVYGSGANAFSADQGYSEHQLGTAADFTTASTAPALDGFDKTSAYAWMVKNAYRYGFILSYPQGNVFYQYEPWHWRFVGTSLAAELHKDKENFYDVDQREINTFLVDFPN